ncbi:MAG TPA: DUF3333 domain-containing protein, partial [Woeseiaceae bacterium]|nr:DUF3333 domain-containing protein [Woeseiaceae bacterium]
MSMQPSATRQRVEAGLRRRYRRETLFRTAGRVATFVGVAFLAIFFWTLVAEGASAFQQTYLRLDIDFSEQALAPGGELDLEYADFDGLVRAALREKFPQVHERRQLMQLNRLVSIGAAYQLKRAVRDDPSLTGTTQSVWVPASADVD